ncbi:MAG: hypothetical protein ABJA75_03705 [Bradyrhizobium sp.]
MKLKMKLTVAILVIVLAPLAALAQQPKAAPKPTKADAERVVKMIGADKAKTALYCQISELGDQIGQAVEKNDDKKADELADKADELGGKIGPEYIALMDGMQELDPKSKDGEDIEKLLADLDKLCQKK